MNQNPDSPLLWRGLVLDANKLDGCATWEAEIRVPLAGVVLSLRFLVSATERRSKEYTADVTVRVEGSACSFTLTSKATSYFPAAALDKAASADVVKNCSFLFNAASDVLTSENVYQWLEHRQKSAAESRGDR